MSMISCSPGNSSRNMLRPARRVLRSSETVWLESTTRAIRIGPLARVARKISRLTPFSTQYEIGAGQIADWGAAAVPGADVHASLDTLRGDRWGGEENRHRQNRQYRPVHVRQFSPVDARRRSKRPPRPELQGHVAAAGTDRPRQPRSLSSRHCTLLRVPAVYDRCFSPTHGSCSRCCPRFSPRIFWYTQVSPAASAWLLPQPAQRRGGPTRNLADPLVLAVVGCHTIACGHRHRAPRGDCPPAVDGGAVRSVPFPAARGRPAGPLSRSSAASWRVATWAWRRSPTASGAWSPGW